ncbi:MAG: hypothetical protein WC784_02825 [Candidatus Shapirobacteria bacterium]|jgi:hypothetical protein
MATNGEYRIEYVDNRGASAEGIPSSGFLVTIKKDNPIDLQSVKEIKDEFLKQDDPNNPVFSEPFELKVGGLVGIDNSQPVWALGLGTEDDEIIPFGSREAAKKIAKLINDRSEQIRHRK